MHDGSAGNFYWNIFWLQYIVSMEIHLQRGVILFAKTGVPSSST